MERRISWRGEINSPTVPTYLLLDCTVCRLNIHDSVHSSLRCWVRNGAIQFRLDTLGSRPDSGYRGKITVMETFVLSTNLVIYVTWRANGEENIVERREQ
jgi:hypothetical protein